VRAGPVEAAAAEVVVDLALLGAGRVGVEVEAQPADAAPDLVELGLGDEEGVVVRHQVRLVVGAEEVQAGPVVEGHHVEVGEAGGLGQAEDLGEEPSRRLRVPRVDDVVVEGDGHPVQARRPSSIRTVRVVVTASSSWRSWVTSSTVPSKASTACSSCSMAGRSRWLVGSSSTRQLVPRACRRARVARVRSPGDSDAAGRATWSAPRPNLASRVRASVAPPRTRSQPAATTKASSSGRSVSSTPRPWSISPTTTPGPR